jgi:hypothetical protein
MKYQKQKKDARQSYYLSCPFVDVWLYRDDEGKWIEEEYCRVECVVKGSEGAYDTLMEY